MRTLLCLLSLFTMALPAYAVEVVLGTDDEQNGVSVEATVGAEEFPLEVIQYQGRRAHRMVSTESLNHRYPGHPDIPRVHRLIAVDPTKRYVITDIRLSGKEVYRGINLLPKQPETIEEAGPAPFTKNWRIYLNPKWYAPGFVQMGELVSIGTLTALPLTIKPVHYHPVRRELHLYRKVSFRIVATDGSKVGPPTYTSLTSFERSQANNLLLNGERITKNTEAVANETMLILTSRKLQPYATDLANYYQESGITPDVRIVSTGSSSYQVKQIIKDAYRHKRLAGVVFYGDESAVPLHYWTSKLPGDSYYGFISGNDYLADIRLGRLPISNASEAKLLQEKLATYRRIQESGFVNKKVMLIAHNEQYPGKYTSNQERIRKAANPLGLKITTMYGGARARNADVIREANTGYAIINYRGHGSDTAWWDWDRDHRSFELAEIRQLDNYDDKLAVFFNIACNNGAIHKQEDSMAELLLFDRENRSSMKRAVGVLASTVPSYTATNHAYDIYLFRYMQKSENISLGNLNALANNKLVIDNGMSPPVNIKMYILFADPLLAPWVK